MLFIKVFYLLGIFVGANKLGHLAINSPLIVGGNIEFIFVPVYQPSRIDVNALQWQVHFNAARSIREIETKRVTVYESGQAVFMELTNVNSSWRHAVVYVKDNGHVSNIVRLELLERSKGILHVMSYPSRIGDIAKDCILST
ncbi:hypothetical protein DPMN_089990 [Dreissena polymorpha]|uniref:Uncharacterized protein n=1 Tax=Dreissena polymorpha TaxID=45954 RepID=A0A9D4KXE9_DREPO|nr:hypothetical protein DPMN_089990 [Dreissena polymorpha]